VTTIALIGPGAIGGTLAGWLAQVPGNEVTLCARTPFDRLTVDVPEGRTLEATLPVLTEPADARPVDWVLAVTKTYDTEGAARWLRRLQGAETRVAIIQNGVEHRTRFAGVVPDDRLLPVIIDIPAERRAPGRIRQHRHGLITAPEGALGREFAALFAGTALAPTLTLTDDFVTAIWRKLTLNSAGVIQALTLRPAGIVRDKRAAELMREIAAETVTVGRAVGAKLDDSLVDEVIARLEKIAPESIYSHHLEPRENRPMEIDARNGVIVRLGAAHGIPTPRNEMAVTLLEVSAPLPGR
jgi:2-dehydropantoate 2-reductase